MAVSYGLGRHGFGLFVPVFRQEFDLSPATVGLIASAGYAGYLVALVVTGLLTRMVGPRLPVVVGCLMAGAGMFGVALAGASAAFAAGVVVAGASAGWTWAPFTDAVSHEVSASDQPRVLSMVNTGSTVGFTLAGAVALLVPDSWRAAWAAFALLALLVAGMCARVLPSGRTDVQQSARLDRHFFLCRRSMPLLLASLGLSLAASAFFTFAPELMLAEGLPRVWGPALWVVIGVCGTVGLGGAAVLERFGLARSLVGCLGGVSAALMLLALWPGSLPAALTSGALFGGAFMLGYSLISLWSQEVFADLPSAGFTATILAGAAGFVLGPALFGAAAEWIGLDHAMGVAALVGLLTIAARPVTDAVTTVS